MNQQLALREHDSIALPDVAVRVNALHDEIGGVLRLSLQKAIEIGGLLAEAKRQTGHGAFGDWLSENVAFTDRTARRYMALFENRERLLRSDNVSDLGSAYRLLSAHSSETEQSASFGTAPDFLPKQGRMAMADVMVEIGSEHGRNVFMLQEDHRNPGFFYGVHISFGQEENDAFIEFTMRPLRADAWGSRWALLHKWLPDGAPQPEWSQREVERDYVWREYIEPFLPRDMQHLRRREVRHA
jgi:hypothetical protein